MKKNLLILATFLFASQLISQTHVQWRGDNRDGKYPDTNLLTEWPAEGPELIWHFDELGVGHASAAVTKDKVYTAGTIDETGYIFAFSHDGDLLWKKEYGPEWTQSYPGVRPSPMIIDEHLYLLTGFGQLFCMNINTMSIEWSIDIIKDYGGRNIRWGYCENLVADGEKLFVTVGGIEHNVIAVNRKTGKLIWTNKGLGEKSAYGSPALIKHNGHKILVLHTEYSALGFNPDNGKLLWSHEKRNRYGIHPNTPIYHDGHIYIVSGYGSGGIMLRLNEEGTAISEVWKDELLDNQMGGVILVDGKLYGGAHAGKKWYCLDWKTGEKLFETNEAGRGNTIFADGLLYFYDERGFVCLIKPEGENTKIISKFKVPYGSAQHWAHLVIAHKKLFVRHGNSLMVYSIAAN